MEGSSTSRDPEYINRRFIYGMELVGKFASDKDTQTLDDGIEAVTEAIDLLPTTGTFEHLWKWLNTLGMALMVRYQAMNRKEDLDHAITQFQRALSCCPTNEPARPYIIAPLVNGLHIRAQRFTHLESLRMASKFCQELVALRPSPHPQRGETLDLLSRISYQLFEHDARHDTIDMAVSVLREATDIYPTNGSSRFMLQSNLGMMLCARHSMSAKSQDMDEGMVLLRGAVSSCPPTHPERSICLHNLAVGLIARASTYSRDVEDVNEALKIEQEAQTVGPPENMRGAMAKKTSQAHTLRSELLGGTRIQYLNEAIVRERQALEQGAEGDSRAEHLQNLGECLYLRYTQLHREDDLTFSFGMHNKSLALRPPGHPARWLSLAFLGFVLSAAAAVDHSNPLHYINPAIDRFREAIQCLPDPKGAALYDTLLPNLARLLKARSDYLQTDDDLDESIKLHKEVIDALQSDNKKDPDSCVVYYHAAESFRTRYTRNRTKYLGDLREAIHYGEKAQQLAPLEHFCYTFILAGLADTYLEEDSPSQDPFSLYRQAVTNAMSPAQFRLEVALYHWARQARARKHESAVDAFREALSLLDRCLTSRPTVQLQYELLSRAPRFVPDACATAIEVGQLETAVELLEQGRGLLWARLTRFRQPLDALRDTNSRLAIEFEATSKELERLATGASSTPATQLQDFNNIDRLLPFEQQAQELHEVSKRWDRVISQIRLQSGELANFLASTPFKELQNAAESGPVIVVNVCDCHSDAIIVRYAAPPVLVPLPDAELDGLLDLSKKLTGSLHWLHTRGGVRTAKPGGYSDPSPYDNSDWIDRFQDLKLERGKFTQGPPRTEGSSRSEIREVLRSLWEWVVKPIAAKLEELGFPTFSRVWWYPTSVLWRLPLHAAGPYRSSQPNFHDLYVSSYMTTFARNLTSLSNYKSSNSTPPSILVVGAPGDPVESSYLPDVEEEICRVLEHSSSGSITSMHVSVGEGATSEAVRDQLQNTSWAHFTCHGFQQSSPFESYFQLHEDKPLTLRDLMQTRLPKAELAFLSACNTATGDRVHDEVIHLTAVMQFCGFHSVIGTLWPMLDEDGPVVAEDFYGYMLHPPNGVISFKNSAEALHYAVDQLRKRKVPIERWINFVHYGL